MTRKVTITLAAVLSATLAVAANIDKRIIGGEDGKGGDFPFIVSIRGRGLSHYCGGSLLDSTTVLTAAHCVEGSESVLAGTLDRWTGGVEAKVASRKQHPNYSGSKVTNGPYAVNDIGILKLSTPIEKSENIGYATLPASGSDPLVNSTAVAAGWGSEYAPDFIVIGSAVDKLKKVVVPVHAREDCSNMDSGAAGRDTIVCAGGNSKNICKMDSGGPLIDQEMGQLIGLASFVIIDADDKYCNLAPSVFTRVSSYIPFITDNIGRSDSGVKEQSGIEEGPRGYTKLTTTATSSSKPRRTVYKSSGATQKPAQPSVDTAALKPFKQPASPAQNSELCGTRFGGNVKFTSEDCVGTKQFCESELWKGTGEDFANPDACLDSRTDPDSIVFPSR